MILSDIKEKLQELDPNIYYGTVDTAIRETTWDYIVFDRLRVIPNANRTGYSCYYGVHIVRENFIPEGLELSVINKMLEIPGMRLAANDMNYEYTVKPSTNNVVEMLSIEFVKPVKE